MEVTGTRLMYSGCNQDLLNNVSTSIRFTNVESDDYEQVQIEISMKGPSFEFGASLTYFNQVRLYLRRFFRP